MKKYLYVISLLMAHAFSPMVCMGQRDSTLSLKLKTNLFLTFVKSVEDQSDYRFYYDPSLLDTMDIDIHLQNKKLEEILDSVLLGSSFHYAIDHRKNVFIVKDRYINTRLADFFFDPFPDTTKIKVPPPERESPYDRKLNFAATLENKIFEIGNKNTSQSGMASLSGYIKEISSGEAVMGAVVFVEETKQHAIADQDGFYSITIPKGKYTLHFQSMGMKNTRRNVQLHANGTLSVEMQTEVQGLKEVVVEKEGGNNVSGLQMGQERLTMKSIRQMPMVFGEADILRAILTLPGVKTVGEASTGFNVRGGSADQNLILFNDAIIYNPSHLFGFFSAFNPDVIKSVELFKSNIPSKLGGRLSSVLDISSREGNKKKLSASGGIGILTSRLAVEGPIVKDKTSFILAGRTTYSNWLLKQLKNSAYKGSKASFYDGNFILNHRHNEKNDFYFSGYLSNDRFNLRSDTVYDYKNENLVLKWKHVYGNKINSIITSTYSKYKYGVESEGNPVNAFRLSFYIRQFQFKADQTYYLNSKHTIDFGVSSIYYQLQPGSYLPLGNLSKVTSDVLQKEQALETALYVSDKYDISERWTLHYGVRYSIYNYLGPKSINAYPAESVKNIYSIKDTLNFGAGEVIKTYHFPEVRLAGRYMITENLSAKVSYNTMTQYIHMLSNTTSISPTDIWKLSDPNIKPTKGDHVSMGIYKNLKMNSIETSLEVYHKRMFNYLDYKGGAVLLQNHHIETEVLSTVGRSFGLEATVKKNSGKLNGWLGYTYSRTFLKMDDPSEGQLINRGEWYPSNYDKPHDFTFAGNYKFTHRLSVSGNVTYSTGRPITLPIAMYDMAGSQRVLYGDRNQHRIPNYFRVDLSVNIEGNHVIKKLAHASWTIGVYNVFGRKNAYSVYFKSEGGKVNGYKLSIFGQPIPTITYNFRF